MSAALCLGALCLGALCVAACASPPAGAQHALSLRDVLLARRDDVAALPLEERLALATRLEAAMEEQRARSAVTLPPPRPAYEVIEAFDAVREREHEDAVVVLAMELLGSTVTLHTLPYGSADAGTAAGEPIQLRIEDDELRADVEAAGSIARTWISRMARDRGVVEVVALDTVPAGLLGDEARVYVNPVWLALLSLHEPSRGLGVAAAALNDDTAGGPVVGHHDTSSSGWGCYTVTPSSCTLCTGGGITSCSPTLTGSCGTCAPSRTPATEGFDCGACAVECGPDSDGVHCTVPARRPTPVSPLEGLWLLVPVAYLAWRRRRG